MAAIGRQVNFNDIIEYCEYERVENVDYNRRERIWQQVIQIGAGNLHRLPPELIDSAILSRSPCIMADNSNPPDGVPIKIRYTRSELLQLRSAPLSQHRPRNIPNAISADQLRSDRRPIEPDDDSSGMVTFIKHRPTNFGTDGTKERQRKEPPNTRRTAGSVNGTHSSVQGERRIGSGRILYREMGWDYRSDQNEDQTDISFRPGGRLLNLRSNDRYSNDKLFQAASRPDYPPSSYNTDRRFERRDYDRKCGPIIDKEFRNIRSSTTANGRYMQSTDRRRLNSHSQRNDEPEWFSGGPTSQHDTIELHGFDDSPADEPKPKDIDSLEGNSTDDQSDLRSSTPTKVPATDGERGDAIGANDTNNNATEEGGTHPDKNTEKMTEAENDFNFEDYLKMESVTDLIANENELRKAMGESRFSQWFRRETSPKDDNARTLQLDIQTILSKNCDKHFAPISPAANHTSTNSLMEFIQRGKFPATKPDDQPNKKRARSAVGQPIHSVEELEKRMRSCRSDSDHVPQTPEDVMAFRNLINMLTKSKPDEDIRRYPYPPIGKVTPEQLHVPMHRMGEAPLRTVPPTTEVMVAGQQYQLQMSTKQLLKRPDAQQLINSLVRGDITKYYIQKMITKHPPSIQRDVLLAVLHACDPMCRVQSPQPHSSSTGAPGIPPMLFDSQQLLVASAGCKRVSPLPNGKPFPVNPSTIIGSNPLTLHVPGAPQRIPSPRELQFHTQSIMQNALIKKKLEEQRENYRKHQEILQQQQQQQQQQHQQSAGDVATQSPSKHHHIQSPTPIAFTPTSVLRKMTADKDIIAEDGASSASGNQSKELNLKRQQTPPPLQQQHNPSNLMQQMEHNIQMQQHQQQQQQQHHQHIQMQQTRMLMNQLAMQNISQSQSIAGQSNHRPLNWGQQPKPLGRPIVKGSGAGTNLHSMQFASNVEMQQYQQQYQRKATGVPSTGNGSQLNILMQQMAAGQQQQQQQQQRQQQSLRNKLQFQQRMQHGPMDGHQNQLNYSDTGIGQRSGTLSPTSNQLARWFSPKLLAQASAGKLPSLNIGKAMSLEEFERNMQHRSSTTIHN